MENQVFSLSKDVEQKTPIFTPSPLTTPTTPRGVNTFGSLMLELNTDNISPNEQKASPSVEEIRDKMSEELGRYNQNTLQHDTNKMSSVLTTKNMAGNDDNKKVTSAKSKRANLRLDIPQTPNLNEPTPTQEANSNDFPLSGRRGQGYHTGHPNHLVSCDQHNCGKDRPAFNTQESIHDPSVGLMHSFHNNNAMDCSGNVIVHACCQNTNCYGQFGEQAGKRPDVDPRCNCGQQCVKCGKRIENINSNKHQNNFSAPAMVAGTVRNNCNSFNSVDNKCYTHSEMSSASKGASSYCVNNCSSTRLMDLDIEYGSEKKRKPSYYLCCTLKIMLLIFVCAAVSAVTTYIMLREFNMTQKSSFGLAAGVDSNDSVCVMCDTLKLTSSVADDYSVALRKVGDKCCAETPKQLEQIIEAIAEKQVRVHQVRSPASQVQYMPNFNRTKNMYAAHVYLDLWNSQENDINSHVVSTTVKTLGEGEVEDDYYENHPDIGDEYETVLGWTKSPSTAFVRSGIIFNETKGRFRVLKDGIYHVYSQMSVKPPAGGAEQGLIFSQRILRENIRFKGHGPRPVLEETQLASCPDTRTNHPCHSGTLSSLLKLRNGDEIFVSVTHLDLVVRDKLSSFFGINRID